MRRAQSRLHSGRYTMNANTYTHIFVNGGTQNHVNRSGRRVNERSLQLAACGMFARGCCWLRDDDAQIVRKRSGLYTIISRANGVAAEPPASAMVAL